MALVRLALDALTHEAGTLGVADGTLVEAVDLELEATNYFFGVPGQEEELELTYNHDGRTYEIGSGYGHIALAVDDLDDTLSHLEQQGIEPEREPYRVREGGSRLCFVRDPDSYRVELIESG